VIIARRNRGGRKRPPPPGWFPVAFFAVLCVFTALLAVRMFG